MSSSSDSSSSASADENADRDPGSGSPESIEVRFSSVALTEPDAEFPDLAAEHQEVENGVDYASAGESDRQLIEGNDEEELVIAAEEEIQSNSGEAEVSEGLARGGVVLGRTISELDVEEPSSPSSSGYAGERGSSGASSGGGSGIDEVGDDEIQEVRSDAVDGVLDSGATWAPGKRHPDEDDASVSWRKRKKHFFILSHSGKPIYSRYGDEHKLAGFSATLQAIISFVENGGDRVKLVRAGKHQVVFLVKGPIYLVCISCTEEPYESLRGQLELMYGQVICLVGAQKASLHPDDMLLLANFVMSSESFRTSESFSPICLPRYNAMAFLYTYVHFFDEDTYLMLLTTNSDAFYHLKDCRMCIEKVLLKSNVLSEVQRSTLEGGMHVEDLPVDPLPRSGSLSRWGHAKLPTDSPERFRETCDCVGGPAGLWHFMYRSIFLDQYVSSEFSAPISSRGQQKRLYRAYQKLYASMHDGGIGPHKTQFRRDENYVLLCWVTQDFELYAAFDPLADKALAIKTCNRVCQWVKDVENEIFLLGASPFSWGLCLPMPIAIYTRI
ncbi:vacuolar fusion protein MON1 homolog isoform X3 [Morus notabilis]|uniref:vacuolar fusion protein MON1 homolog isoform X3 n=1 Tax=Morus notabilis TaxID=981085 RepID=UPI000CED5984|nr:vacuolar fusion protein MON1 homolog isoform X3 [Morus notabilis]